MNITVVGAGNIGIQLAVLSKIHDNKVVLYTRRPDKITTNLTLIDSDSVRLEREIDLVTDSIEEAVSTADVIWVTYPLRHMGELSVKMQPYINPGTVIVLVPGSSGADCYFENLRAMGAVICGMERVPCIARLESPGVTKALGYKDQLFIATKPANQQDRCKEIMEDILHIPCVIRENFLEVSMITSNAILHTARCYDLFNLGQSYGDEPLFYQGWTDHASQILLDCDKEVMEIYKALGLNSMESLAEHYENDTAEGFTSKIRSIEAFKGLKAPVRQVQTLGARCSYAADFQSRYFTSDFACGLQFFVKLAELLKIDHPNMKILMDWYVKASGDHFELPDLEYILKEI